MKTLTAIFLCICLGLSSVGCESSAARQQEVVSQSAYAINDSMRYGRFDLAKQYSDEQIRVIAPPKKRVVVKPLYRSNN